MWGHLNLWQFFRYLTNCDSNATCVAQGIVVLNRRSITLVQTEKWEQLLPWYLEILKIGDPLIFIHDQYLQNSWYSIILMCTWCTSLICLTKVVHIIPTKHQHVSVVIAIMLACWTFSSKNCVAVQLYWNANIAIESLFHILWLKCFPQRWKVMIFNLLRLNLRDNYSLS